jgi:hypothetical protein
LATKGGAANSGGGVNIADAIVNTAGGDIVGRDKIQYASARQLEGIFRPVAHAIEVAAPAQRAAATEKLQALKDETAKGKNADDSNMGKLVDGLVSLVPGAVSAIVSAFGTPLLGGITGPVTKYVLDRIQGK